jgi:hypothetical protein
VFSKDAQKEDGETLTSPPHCHPDFNRGSPASNALPGKPRRL